MTKPTDIETRLKRRFKKLDELKLKLNKAERELKYDLHEYARANNLKAIPRPETVRSVIS